MASIQPPCDCQYGIRYVKVEYPWGGYDWVPVFCDCPTGQAESDRQHAEAGLVRNDNTDFSLSEKTNG